MTDWQPIETAPKDGTEILTIQMLEGDYFKRQAIMYWYLPPAKYRWNLTDDDTMKRFPISPIGYWRGEIYLNPTHWMPLPNAPEPPK